MWDIFYLLGTVAFFGLMVAFVAGCARLGAGAIDDRGAE
jgi:hypothetical protein